ncbi:MAG: BspA family leucine-rich repeat surface protein [Clostridia bacterium]|nr:BspA family leucine-rich repeat surface protein [Clostridia bacterium]
MNTTLNSAGLSVQYSLTVAGNLYGVYTYNDEEYLKLTAPKSVSVSLDGTSVNFVAGSFYWYKLEPIRWRLSDFGVAESERDSIIPSSRTEDVVKTAVSDVVLDWGAIASGSVSEGWKYSDSAQYLAYNTNFGNESCQINFAAEVEREFDYFNADGTNIAVKSENITTTGVYQVSQDELNENFTSKVAYASDLVCMMAGISNTQYCDYWTRDLTTINNATYITSTGIARNRYLTSSCGVRLSYSVLAPANVAYLKTGQQLNALMKNADDYTVKNSVTTSIIFDYYTASGQYAPNGTNLIAGLSGTPVDVDEAGKIMLYGAGTSTIYVLSLSEITARDLSYTFYGFYWLGSAVFNNLITSQTTNMSYMFAYCGEYDNENPSLNLDLTSFDTSNVTDMSGMFFGSRNLVGLNVSNWNVEKVTTMDYMFGSTVLLNSLDFSGWTVKASVQEMFGNCGINQLDLSSWNVSGMTNMTKMFSGWRFGGSLNLSGWDTSSVTNMSNMFTSCGEWTTSFNLDLTSFDTSSVTDMSSMFLYCGYSATSFELDLSSFDTSSVTSMEGMFVCCGYNSSNFILDISHFNTSSVTNMSNMFSYCGYSASNFTLDLSSFDTSSVTNMSSMFYYCGYSATNLSLDLSSFNTAKVIDMGSMFSCCGYSATSLSLNLSSFDTSSVTYTRYMFQSCGYSATNLSLDLSSFDTSKVTNMTYMFQNCRYLKTVYVSDKWTTSAVTSSTYMFNGCSALVGGNGTKYSSSYKDKTYARIDGKDGLPGYFTDVAEKYKVALKTGQELNALMKNASSYSTSNRTVQKIVFDYYRDSSGNTTQAKVYYVNGTNVISGMTGVDATAGGNGEALIYNAGRATVYVLSAKEMMMNEDASYMFQNFGGIKSLESFFNFNTSKTTNMSYMFNCKSEASGDVVADISSFDTSNVINMSHMFESFADEVYGDKVYANLSNLDATKVEDMSYMFSWFGGHVGAAVELNLSGFKAKAVKNLNSMFASAIKYCYVNSDLNVPELDLSGIDTSNVCDMDYMFGYSCLLETVYVSDKWTTSAVTSSYGMFDACFALVGGNGTTYSDSYTDASYARIDGKDGLPGYFTDIADKYPVFLKAGKELNALMKNVSEYTTVDKAAQKIVFDFYRNENGNKTAEEVYYVDGENVISGLAGVDATADESGMAKIYGAGCTTVYVLSNKKMALVDASYALYAFWAVTAIEFYNFDTSNATNMEFMFAATSSTTSILGLQHALTSLNLSTFNTSKVTNMKHMFMYCKSMTSLDISSFDTSNVTDMYGMFYSCQKLTSLDVSNFDTSNVIDMSSMFYNCQSLTSLDVSNFDTSKAIDISLMFSNCVKLTSLDVSNFDTSNVINMVTVFGAAMGKMELTSLDLSGWDTSKVTDMRSMFSGCYRFTSLDLSNFDTSNVTYMGYMFNFCSSLTSLDLSNFDTSNVANMRYMFSGCSSLRTIYVSDKWSISAVTESIQMFQSTKALVGGNGTAFNSSYTDATYARIDAAGSPGYFTYKAAPAESASEGQGNENVVIAFGSGAVAIFGVVAFVWFYRKKKTGRFVGRMNK